MPRTGKHPLKLRKHNDIPESMPKPVTVTTVVHIPILDGYWVQSLDVLRVFFESLYTSTSQPFDLMVFDNNSCAEVKDYLLQLQREGKIQYLTFSKYNLKKLGAMDFLFANAPGEFAAFADSDVYFLPGWLEESISVLKAFPEAGQVTALPTIDKRHHYTESTISGIQEAGNLTIERGVLIPDARIDAHRISIARDKADYLQNAGARDDIRITRDGVSAYVSAQDFQFVTRKEVIRQSLPLEVRHRDEYYDPIYSPVFEAKLDELGLWRLSTTEYLVHHMGNHLPDLAKELEGITNEPLLSISRRHVSQVGRIPSWRRRILEIRLIRSLLKRIYTRAYTLLFEK